MTVFDGADVALHRSTAVDGPRLLRILRLVSIVGNLRIKPTHCEIWKTTLQNFAAKMKEIKCNLSRFRYLSPIEIGNETIDRTFYLCGQSAETSAQQKKKNGNALERENGCAFTPVSRHTLPPTSSQVRHNQSNFCVAYRQKTAEYTNLPSHTQRCTNM